MRIEVVSGTGSGPTELAAFDAAEMGAGLSNSNLITLSSIIPSGVEVVELDTATSLAGAWGDRVYSVVATTQTSRRGNEIWAGVGWVILEMDGGRGLFAEHIGGSRESVEQQLWDSLLGFMDNRGLKPDQGLIKMRVAGITCHDQPVCAFVAAVFQSQAWS